MKLELPLLWRNRWRIPNPFWHIQRLTGTIYRQQAGRKTLRFIEDGVPYFLKYHSGIGWREWGKNILQGRRPVLGARNEVVAIQQLMPQGFVPNLIAYGWQGQHPLYQQSFIITQALDQTVSLEQFAWLTSRLALKRALIRRIAQIVRQIHQQNIHHQDLYLCHFLLDITGGEACLAADAINLFVIDWHRAHIRKNLSFRWRLKDLSALYFSALDIGLTRQDKYRFIKAYGANFAWQQVEQRAHKLYQKVWRKLTAPQLLPCYLHSETGERFYLASTLSMQPWILRGHWRQQAVKLHLYISPQEALKQVPEQTLLYQGWIQQRALYILITPDLSNV